jgi:hypothetical protein
MAAGGLVALDLQPTFVWDFNSLSQVHPRGRGYAADLTPIRIAGALPTVNRTTTSQLFNHRFGRADCPEHAASAENPAGGFFIGIGYTNWMLSEMAQGRAVWAYVAQMCPYSAPAAPSNGVAPVLQNGHLAPDQSIFRVRFQATTRLLATAMGESDNGDGVTNVVITNVTYEPTSYDADADPDTAQIGLVDNRLVEWLVQVTPNDPALSADTHKHNLYVAARTTNTDGTSYFPLTQYAQYATGSAGAKSRNLVSNQRFTLARSEVTTVNGGYQGYYLGLASGSLPTNAVVTNTTDLGRWMDEMKSMDPTGLYSGRGRGRGR